MGRLFALLSLADARTAQGGPWLTEHPELRCSLSPYLGNKRIILCEVGKRANQLRGCFNTCLELPPCTHDPRIPVDPQYSYKMNSYLGGTLTTSGMGTLEPAPSTFRQHAVARETRETRSPSDVFLFGEQNSWAVNTEGKQPMYQEPYWPAPII